MIAAASFDETLSRRPRGVDGDATSTGNKGGVLATVRQGAGTARLVFSAGCDPLMPKSDKGTSQPATSTTVSSGSDTTTSDASSEDDKSEADKK